MSGLFVEFLRSNFSSLLARVQHHQHQFAVWYMCDLNSDVPVENRTFANLKHYQLIRLKHGTGIVHVSGTEHGRRCLPHKNGPEICQPPPPAN